MTSCMLWSVSKSISGAFVHAFSASLLHPYQRWAPNGYNPNPIDLPLGISVHGTDFEQEVSEPDRVLGLDRAGTPQGRVENEQKGAAD